jgi:hypothetical protein
LNTAKTRRALIAATCGAAALAPVPSAAQQVHDEPTPAFFGEVSSRLNNWPGVLLGRPTVRRAPVNAGPEAYNFIEFLPAHQQRLTLNLKQVTEVDAVVGAFRAVRTALEVSCVQGALLHREVAPRISKVVLGQPSDALVTAAYRRLYEDGLVGRFDCTLPEDSLAWTLTVLWDQGEREPDSVIPSDQWRFRLESVSVERLNRQQIRFEEFKRSTDALRAKPNAGGGVQVLLDELPGYLGSHYGRPFNPDRLPVFVCGLVVGSKKSVVDIQFGKERLVMPPSKLYPIGTQVTVAEMGLYIEAKSPPHKTCLRP